MSSSSTTSTTTTSTKERCRIRVGRDFLQVKGSGQVHLKPYILSSRPGPDFSFSLITSVVSMDSLDGDVEMVKQVLVEAARGRRVFYLSVQRDHLAHPYAHRVTLEEKPGEESYWVLTPIPGGSRFLLESWLVRDYCLANDGGRLCLQRVSRAKRSKQLNIYPIP